MTSPTAGQNASVDVARAPVPDNGIPRGGPPPRREPRWPAALAIVTVFLLVAGLPARVRVVPEWVTVPLLAALFVGMVAVTIAPGSLAWARAEHIITLIVVAIGIALTINSEHVILQAMFFHSETISALSLLASAITVWIMNVMLFSLFYWHLDQGGPSARARVRGPRPDFLFAQMTSGDRVPADWRPSFADYLFLGFTTATAFSPCDTLPLTSRAKMLMMVQATISLVTIGVVAARAINVLGS